jgi:hypothetical protein
MKLNKAPKLAFSSDCAESQSLTFMATTKSETDIYAYVTGSSGSSAWLVSEVIPKQIGAGVLTFSYWKSKNSPSLRVCGRKPPGYPNALDCNWYSTNEFHGQQWVKDRVIIPPSDSAFEIIFVAQITDRNNLISIDDIQYRASLGDIQENPNLVQSARLAQQTGPTELRIPRVGDGGQLADTIAVPSDTSSRKSKDPSSSGFTLAKNVRDSFRILVDARKCPWAACDFDENLCKYTNVAAGLWRQGKARVGNRITGINGDQNGDGGFAYATQTLPSDQAFAISTRPFMTALAGSASFAYHMSGHTGRLRVCDITLDDCTLIAENTAASFSAKLLGWQTAELPVTPGSHQLIFVADRIPQNYIVGLDNIQLWDKTKTLELECFAANQS